MPIVWGTGDYPPPSPILLKVMIAQTIAEQFLAILLDDKERANNCQYSMRSSSFSTRDQT
jgi:hypothetical protein